MQKIKIRTPKNKKKEGVGGINSILQSHFVCLIVGKPGSGKSHLLYELLMNPGLYFKKFDRVFFCTPTEISKDLNMKSDNWKTNLDCDWLLSKIKECEKQSNVLIILDDVIAELRKEMNNPLLKKLIFNRRHLIEDGTVSFIITSQKYIVCPPAIRSCLSSIIIFKVNPADWKKIKEECIFIDGVENGSVLREAYNRPYNFIYARLDNSCIYSNFENQIN